LTDLRPIGQNICGLTPTRAQIVIQPTDAINCPVPGNKFPLAGVRFGV
jgi:hypothetical protein